MRKVVVLVSLSLAPLSLALAGCASTTPTGQHPRSAPPPTASPRPAATLPHPSIVMVPGLENVLGQTAAGLVALFGPPRLDVQEGDARKLQWRGEACVLDAYLYPLDPGREPQATYVDTRRSSDGRDVDKAACAAALRKG